jgi:putative addiction module killer protein
MVASLCGCSVEGMIRGESLSEMRIDFGPGFRVYYARAGKTLYLLLCGGDKGSQDADIKNAHAMWNRSF